MNAENTLPGRLVLVGHPVAHSFSPAMQNAALRAAGISLEYEALDVPPSELARVAGLLAEARAAGNVTIPWKTQFMSHCVRTTPVASRVGAVNTFWTEDDGLVGDNTDVGGFERAIAQHFGARADAPQVLLIGAGGAAAAVLAAVERWENARAFVVSRTHDRARKLAERFSRFAIAVPHAIDVAATATLVVNATPVGLHGDELPLDPAILPAGACAYDLTYRRGETPWVRACRARGLRAHDGRTMLVEQGALAFERWFGRSPDRRAMHAALP